MPNPTTPQEDTTMIRYGVKQSKKFSVPTWKGYEEMVNDNGLVLYRIYREVNFTRPEDALDNIKRYGELSKQVD
jgi:hypothetical protein